MIGNDDCGQMSAWYILSCLGFYPVNPAGNEFVLGAPQVKKATLHIGNEKQLIIKARNFSQQNIYSEEVLLNSEKMAKPFITFEQIIKGGSITFGMNNK